jgi:hypothetical protein
LLNHFPGGAYAPATLAAFSAMAPETPSEFAAHLSAWFKNTYPAAPDVPIRFVEEAIRGTWHRRHEVIGGEL